LILLDKNSSSKSSKDGDESSSARSAITGVGGVVSSSSLSDVVFISNKTNSSSSSFGSAAGGGEFLDQTLRIDHSTNVKSVKEHAKKLNRLNTELKLRNLNNEMTADKSTTRTDDLNDFYFTSNRIKVDNFRDGYFIDLV
jgi:hypothetical protein